MSGGALVLTNWRLVGAALRLRAQEWIVWMGIPAIGAMVTQPVGASWLPAVGGFVGIGFCVVHMLLLNDWAGLVTNPAESQRFGFDGDASPRAGALGLAALVALVLGLACLAAGSWSLLALGTLWASLSFLYSHPWPHGKARPWAAEVIHVLGGVTLYGLGAAAVGEPRMRMEDAAPAIFLGLVLVAGHLNHQVTDADEDARGRIVTLGTRYGGHRVLRASLVAFLFAHLGLVAAWAAGWVPTAFAVAFSMPLVGHAVFALRRVRSGATGAPADIARDYRRWYRAAFALAIVAFVLLRGLGLAGGAA